MSRNTTAETPLGRGSMDSPLRRSPESESTGYSTDYSTFEISRQCRRSSSVLGRTLPDRSLDVSPRRARSSVYSADREECRELLGASGSTGLAGNSVGPDEDGDESEDEEEEKEDEMRDDPQCCPTNINCSLIPACVIRRWKICRVCYIIWIAILLIIIVITTGVLIFWGVEIFKYRSHISKTVDLSTSGAYDVMSEFPLSNVYGDSLCLSFQQPSSKLDITKLSYVSLISESCNDVTTTIQNESLYRNSSMQYSSYMFNWLRGTTIKIRASSNGKSLVTLYLLNDTVSENYCSMHLQPKNIVKKWQFDINNCYLVHPAGNFDCHLQTTINSSGTYYICINSTIFMELSYEINISSVIYNTSASKTSLTCTQGKDCCLPFDNLFSEALHPTCMYISTQALLPEFLGMKLVNVNIHVEQRLSVIRNCFILLFVLLFILGVTVMFFFPTCYKANHPNVGSRGCTVHCNLYGIK